MATEHDTEATRPRDAVTQGPLGEAADASPPSTPPRALAISLLSLAAAVLVSLLSPEAVEEYSGLVWALALVPVFLFSYYRGWRGATVAAVLAMLAVIGVEVAGRLFGGGGVDWWLLGIVTALLIPVTLGSGLLSEFLHRQRRLALRLAYRDALTGLPNRRLLHEHATKAMAAAAREGSRVAVVFLDLARFKRINDSLGHAAGDEALIRVAERLREGLRASDTVARVGGDEFAFLLTDVRSLEDALRAARRLRKQLARPITLEEQTVHLAARIGVSIFPDHAATFDELLSRADPVGPDGKAEPADIVVFDPARASLRGREVAFEEDLREALQRGELALNYQPIFSLADGSLVGAEALVRWRHPRWGPVSALELVASAEHTGLARRLEAHVVETALRQAHVWSASRDPGWMAVNLSPASFDDPELANRLTALLETVDWPPDRLVLEITERAAMRNPTTAADNLAALRDRGIRLAIDDFGTGHSSLAYLTSFPVDFLKIDMSFVARLGRDPLHERLVEGIIGLGRGLGLRLIAEGVETEGQYRWLEDSGCDFVQGYYTGRPAAAGRFMEAARIPLAATSMAGEPTADA